MIHRWILPGLETFDDIWLVGGWALPLWKTMEFVSWDDDIPNWMENKIDVPKHQPVMEWQKVLNTQLISPIRIHINPHETSTLHPH